MVFFPLEVHVVSEYFLLHDSHLMLQHHKKRHLQSNVLERCTVTGFSSHD